MSIKYYRSGGMVIFSQLPEILGAHAHPYVELETGFGHDGRYGNPN